jgi:hypothetical protein
MSRTFVGHVQVANQTEGTLYVQVGPGIYQLGIQGILYPGAVTNGATWCFDPASYDSEAADMWRAMLGERQTLTFDGVMGILSADDAFSGPLYGWIFRQSAGYLDNHPRLRPIDFCGEGSPEGVQAIPDGYSRFLGPAAAPYYYFDYVSGWLYKKTDAISNTGWTILFCRGADSPEGVISAPVGAFYCDETVRASYQKQSGSGNTGWEIENP